MEKKICDICGCEVDQLRDLQSHVQVEDVKQICQRCLDVVLDAAVRMDRVLTRMKTDRVRQFILRLKRKFFGEPDV
jgi:hypothetical protein